METQQQTPEIQAQEKTKFCKHCGGVLPFDAVLCTHCGRQVEEFASANQPQIVINNQNTNANVNTNTNVNANANAVVGIGLRAKNKWVAFFLCLFLGFLGAHKFYEGKIGMGFLYLLTVGLFGIGWFIDLIALLLKPNPYFVA